MTTSPTSPPEHPIDQRIETLGLVLAGAIRLCDRDLIEDSIAEMRARLDQVELGLHGLPPDPEAELAPLNPPTPAEVDALVRLWDALPEVLSEQGVVTALVTVWAAIRRGDATLADLTVPSGAGPGR